MIRLGRTEYPDSARLVMAIVNRTPDSFYDKGATFRDEAAMERVHRVVEEGATIVDIGGVKAAPGDDVDAGQEMDRVVGFVAAVRAAYPDLVISVDTWRADVGRAVCEVGADLLNDAWGGHDPGLAAVAAEFDVGLVCTHVGGAAPRTRPHRVRHDDVVADAIAHTVGEAQRAVALGVHPRAVFIDPAHDFGKNTWHSLELTRRLGEMAATGWPVLVSLSRKDFVGETLDLPVDERLNGTLAATAISAWLGANVFRAHDVRATREVLEMVATIAGDRLPTRTVRGLA